MVGIKRRDKVCQLYLKIEKGREDVVGILQGKKYYSFRYKFLNGVVMNVESVLMV